MNKKEKTELKRSKRIVLVLVIAGLAIVIWLSWFKKASTIHSFNECARAGNPVLMSYPQICTTKDGHRFVQPSGQPTRPPGY